MSTFRSTSACTLAIACLAAAASAQTPAPAPATSVAVEKPTYVSILLEIAVNKPVADH